MSIELTETKLDVTTLASDPRQTIGRSAAATVAAAPVPTGNSEPPAARALPRISVELRGTMGQPDRGEATPAVRDDRDLEVVSTLGEGGMGRVFLAKQHSLDREVAIKTVRDTASEREREALLVEGAITGHLEHPGVIPVHALGIDEQGRPVLVMKRVQGVTWTDLLEDPAHAMWTTRGSSRQDRLDDHLEILMKVCDAAEFAHAKGVVHRDIKPDNVLIGSYGEVYLGDWGLAFRYGPGAPPTLCGTPAYMAPEMAVGGQVDPRTDVYLLGATLHQVLTGRARHLGTTARQAMQLAAASEPYAYRDTVPAELAALANAATHRDPEHRPATAADLRRAVSAYLRHKASLSLAHTAAARLDALRKLASETTLQSADERQREQDVLLAEARLALKHALDEWPENPEALAARKELEQLLAKRHARAAELERLAREHDPTISHRQRQIAMSAVGIVGVGLSISSFVIDRSDASPMSIFLESLGPSGIVLVMLVALRRHLFRTALNRRSALGMLIAVLGVTASRALGLVSGATSPEILARDLLLLATVSFLAATFVFARVAWVGVLLGAASVVATVLPAFAMRAFALGTGLSLLLVIALVRTMPRAR